MGEIIDTITPFFYQHRYIFVFLGALFEGTNIMLLAGFLYKLGLFKFWNVLGILILGYFLNAYSWYAIGRIGGPRVLEKWLPHFHFSKGKLKRLEFYFREHSTKAFFITRITYGLSCAFLMMAGALKMKLRKFFGVNILASFVWVIMMFSIGYTFGASYALLSKVVKVITVWLVVVLFIVITLVAIGLVYWLRKKARMKFLEKVFNQESWRKLKWLGEKIYKFLDKNV